MAPSSHPPVRTQPGRRRHRTAFVTVLGVVIAVAVLAIIGFGGRDGDDSTRTGPSAANTAAGSDGMDGEQTTETIDLDGVPEQIPASILPDDAQQITGRLATHGDAWSAFARFQSEMSSHALVDHIQLAATGEGYTHREHAHDGTSTVSVYDGADGSILTVTVHDLGERRSVGAVRVSP